MAPSTVPAVSGQTPLQGVAAPALENQETDKDRYFTLDELKGEMKKLTWRKGDFQVTPYGTFWGSMSYATSRTYPGNFTLFALSNTGTNHSDQFYVDCRSSRFGLDVLGPSLDWWGGSTTGGKLEIDFQRMIDYDNKSSLLLRQAYVEVKNSEYRLLVGQTWDVTSPLVPGVLSYFCGGNIGYRRPQFRAERYIACSDTTLITVQGALAADVASSYTTGVTEYNSGWPVLEGRVGLTLGPRGKDLYPIEVGVSAHIGQLDYDIASPYPAIAGLERITWSINGDVKVPIIGNCFGVEGEVFSGSDLAPFFGGIVQGIDIGSATIPGSYEPIRTSGGWFDVWYDWTSKLHTRVGWALDDPVNHDVTVGRIYNAFIFANVTYDITPKFLVGLEYTSWQTHYATVAEGTPQEVEVVVKYGF